MQFVMSLIHYFIKVVPKWFRLGVERRFGSFVTFKGGFTLPKICNHGYCQSKSICFLKKSVDIIPKLDIFVVELKRISNLTFE